MRRPGGRGGGGRGGGGRGGEGGEFWGRGRGGLDGRVVHGGFPSAHGNGGRGVQGGRGGRYQTTNTYPQNPQHQLLISTNVPTLDTYYTYINYG